MGDNNSIHDPENREWVIGQITSYLDDVHFIYRNKFIQNRNNTGYKTNFTPGHFYTGLFG